MFARSTPVFSLAVLPFVLLVARGEGELPPPEFQVDPYLKAAQRAKLQDVDADVRAPRVGLDLSGQWTLLSRLQLGLETDFEHSHYRLFNFDQVLPGVAEPLRDAFQVKLSPRLKYALDDRWALLAGATVGAAGSPDADLQRSFTYGGFVGFHRQFDERFGMTFGVAASTRLEDHVHVLPLVGVNWRISQRWRLDVEGAGGKLSYAFRPPLRVFVGLAYELHEFRFAGDSSIPEGVLRDQSFPVSLGLDWRPYPATRVVFALGSNFDTTYRVRDSQGHTLFDKDAAGAPFVSLAIHFGFGGRPANTSGSADDMRAVPLDRATEGDPALGGPTVQFWEENDSMSGTDDNYSQGGQIAYLAPEYRAGELPAWMNWFGEGLPALGYNVERARFTFAAGQLIFTPLNIHTPVLQVGDHPYSAWLYGAPALQRRGLTAGGMDVLEEVRIGLGWVGPGALGGEAQNFIHRNFTIAPALGWEHQLRNEPTGDFTYARAWRKVLLGERDAGAVEFIPHFALVGGTPRTQAAAGGTMRFGVNLPDDFGPPTIQSTLPISGGAPQRFGAYLFAAIEGRALARDTFLDGDLWRSGDHVESLPLGLESRVGVAVTWHCLDLGFTYARQSPEFKGQGYGNHDYGAIWANWRL